MNYMVRKATINDLPRILEIYEYAKSFMIKTGNPTQWRIGGPTEEKLMNDINLGNLYAIEDDEGIIHASFMFALGIDHTNDIIYEGNWGANSDYGVIHRVAGDSTLHGVLAMAVRFAEEHTKHLRIDTHRDNIVMQGAILKNGFSYRGIILIDDGTERLAYEKNGKN